MINRKNYIFHYTLDKDNKDYILDIPYYEIIKKINGNDFRKFFIVDIRNLNQYEEIFKNFNNFQDELLSKEYFLLKKDTNYPLELSLYFLVDDNKVVNYRDILYDFNYGFKDFINIDKYNEILSIEENLIVPNRSFIYDYNGSLIQVSNFNLLYGLNGSGKTRFLKDVSLKNDFPMFILNQKFDDNKRILSGSSQYLENLSQIINYCENEKLPLLIDDLCWYSFDNRNKIKVIDKLYDYSHNHNVFFTSAQSDIKQLVKRRTHNPNIIDFNDK